MEKCPLCYRLCDACQYSYSMTHATQKQYGREAEKKAFLKSTEADAADGQKHNMKQHRH